jgi:hypothetical protein
MAPPSPAAEPSRIVIPYSAALSVTLNTRLEDPALIVSRLAPGPLITNVLVMFNSLPKAIVCGLANVPSNVIVDPDDAQAMASRSEPAPESAVLLTTVQEVETTRGDRRPAASTPVVCIPIVPMHTKAAKTRIFFI